MCQFLNLDSGEEDPNIVLSNHIMVKIIKLGFKKLFKPY
jgi:hypothetical protein